MSRVWRLCEAKGASAHSAPIILGQRAVCSRAAA